MNPYVMVPSHNGDGGWTSSGRDAFFTSIVHDPGRAEPYLGSSGNRRAEPLHVMRLFLKNYLVIIFYF